MANPLIRKRTIQHPGFEFFETDMSVYKEFEQDTDSLTVGYFNKGPILTPIRLENLNDYTKYFGNPETEAEVYFYKGISAVLDAGSTITAVRLPYDNSTATINTESAPTLNYKVIRGKFNKVGDIATKKTAIETEVKAEDATEIKTEFENLIRGENPDIQEDELQAKVEEMYEAHVEAEVSEKMAEAFGADMSSIADAYEKAPEFVEVLLSQAVINQAELTGVISGTDANADFVIVNKYNDAITKRGEEIFVTMIGTPNALANQGLATETIPVLPSTALIQEDAPADSNLFARDWLKWQTNGEINDEGQLLTVAHSFDGKLANWHPTVPTYSKTVDGETKVYVDPRQDDRLTVLVYKVKPSTMENGKFNIEILESFNGSIFKGHIDPISNESDYLGDLINNSSNYISFYGKSSYKDYDVEKNVVYTHDLEALRLSWGQGIKTTATSPETEDLSKIFVTADKATEVDYVNRVIRPALAKVKNNVKYVYRDVFDFGLSTIVSHMDSTNEGLVYQPWIADGTNPVPTVKSTIWRKCVLAFARHCQYDHKLSMFHADGPRSLVLNGNLSICDDLYQDQLDAVFKADRIQPIAIKDNTYLDVNVQWHETQDEWNKTMIWMPSSVNLAYNLMRNDQVNYVWTAPAGHNYGVVNNITRVAFNPEYETMDRLYLNCLNYGVTWPDHVTTIEGQKTGYGETSALNRINVRRLLIFLERWAQTVSSKYLYEPNTSDVRASYKADLETEFARAYTFGGLYAYRIVCDESNNSPEVIDRNELRVAIMVQPTKTIEFILANFIITKTGVNLEEISPVF